MRSLTPCLSALALLAVILPTPSRAQPADAPTVAIINAVDGDTVDVRFADGTVERTRLIGIDTPETVDPTRPVGCYGAEASAKTQELALGRTALLELDAEQRDRFGRLLGYLYLDDGAGPWMLNERLAAEGFAQQLTIPPNVRYAERLAAAVQWAQSQGLGLWGGCQQPAPQAAPAAPPPPAPAAPAPAAGDCDPSYPDVCIPRHPPDLDCGQIPHKRFRVLPPDPHRFDADRDGIGCET